MVFFLYWLLTEGPWLAKLYGIMIVVWLTLAYHSIGNFLSKHVLFHPLIRNKRIHSKIPGEADFDLICV